MWSFFLFIASILSIGGVVTFFLSKKTVISPVQKYILAFGIGTAIITLELFLYYVVLQQAFNLGLLWFFGIQSLVSITWLAYKIDWKKRFEIQFKKITILSWIIGLFIALIFFFSLVQALGKPPIAFDTIAFWGMRANILLVDGSVNFDSSANNFLATFSHSNYPWHLSLLEYWFRLIGASGAQVNLIAWFYMISLALVLADFCIRRLGQTYGLFLTFILCSQPLIFYHSFNNYADLIIGFYLASGFIFFLQWLENQSRLYLILSALFIGWSFSIKNYGTLYCLIFLMTLAYYWRNKWPSKQSVATVLCSLVIPSLPFAIVKLVYNLNLRNSAASYSWHPEIFIPFFERFFTGNSWNIWWFVFIVLASMSAIHIRRNRNVRTAWLFFGLLVIAILAIFVFTENYQWALDHTALSRAFIPLVPISIALIAFSLQDKKYGTILSRF